MIGAEKQLLKATEYLQKSKNSIIKENKYKYGV